MSAKLVKPLKWHGGKDTLANWIVSLMPSRCLNPNAPDCNDTGWLHYVEPYFGGGSVLLAMDPEGVSEVANDLNAELANFWDVLRTPTAFGDLLRLLETTPFSERSWKRVDEECSRLSGVHCGTDVARAWKFFVKCRMSLAGRNDSFTGITRKRTRRGMNAESSAWLSCVEGLPAVHARLKRVLIRNQPALEIIRKEDGSRTLFYLDPPYLHETRATKTEYGDQEMSEADHKALLSALEVVKGRFLLSGYRSDLYDRYATACGWKRHEMEVPNSASGGKTKRMMTECVWTNY